MERIEACEGVKRIFIGELLGFCNLILAILLVSLVFLSKLLYSVSGDVVLSVVAFLLTASLYTGISYVIVGANRARRDYEKYNRVLYLKIMTVFIPYGAVCVLSIAFINNIVFLYIIGGLLVLAYPVILFLLFYNITGNTASIMESNGETKLSIYGRTIWKVFISIMIALVVAICVTFLLNQIIGIILMIAGGIGFIITYINYLIFLKKAYSKM